MAKKRGNAVAHTRMLMFVCIVNERIVLSHPVRRRLCDVERGSTVRLLHLYKDGGKRGFPFKNQVDTLVSHAIPNVRRFAIAGQGAVFEEYR